MVVSACTVKTASNKELEVTSNARRSKDFNVVIIRMDFYICEKTINDHMLNKHTVNEVSFIFAFFSIYCYASIFNGSE